MSYFSRRNKHIVEFSGYEEISSGLRKRLTSVMSQYVGQNAISYGNDDPWYIEPDDFIYEVRKEFPGKNPFEILVSGEFHEVFTVVEIFLDMARGIYYTRRNTAPGEIQQAFDLSGSVYTIDKGRVELRVSERLARKIEDTKSALSPNSSAYEKFFNAVGDLIGRKAKPEDVVKDIFIGFEDYLKEKTGMKDYGSAVDSLLKNNTVSPTQKALLEKLYAYRSDTYGVGHAGNSQKPHEIDAVWFLETVIAQILFIDSKLKQNVKS